MPSLEMFEFRAVHSRIVSCDWSQVLAANQSTLGAIFFWLLKLWKNGSAESIIYPQSRVPTITVNLEQCLLRSLFLVVLAFPG